MTSHKFLIESVRFALCLLTIDLTRLCDHIMPKWFGENPEHAVNMMCSVRTLKLLNLTIKIDSSRLLFISACLFVPTFLLSLGLSGRFSFYCTVLLLFCVACVCVCCCVVQRSWFATSRNEWKKKKYYKNKKHKIKRSECKKVTTTSDTNIQRMHTNKPKKKRKPFIINIIFIAMRGKAMHWIALRYVISPLLILF